VWNTPILRHPRLDLIGRAYDTWSITFDKSITDEQAAEYERDIEEKLAALKANNSMIAGKSSDGQVLIFRSDKARGSR